MKDISPKKIEAMIYNIDGQRVMLDSDLAKLYSVDTRYLGRQVRQFAVPIWYSKLHK